MLITCVKGTWRDAIGFCIARPMLVFVLLAISALDAFLGPLLNAFHAAQPSSTEGFDWIPAATATSSVMIVLCVAPIVFSQAIRHAVLGAKTADLLPVMDRSFWRFFRQWCVGFVLGAALFAVVAFLAFVTLTSDEMNADQIAMRIGLVMMPIFMILIFFGLRYEEIIIKTALGLHADTAAAWRTSRGKVWKMIGVYCLSWLPLIVLMFSISAITGATDTSSSHDASMVVPNIMLAVLNLLFFVLWGTASAWIYKIYLGGTSPAHVAVER